MVQFMGKRDCGNQTGCIIWVGKEFIGSRLLTDFVIFRGNRMPTLLPNAAARITRAKAIRNRLAAADHSGGNPGQNPNADRVGGNLAALYSKALKQDPAKPGLPNAQAFKAFNDAFDRSDRASQTARRHFGWVQQAQRAIGCLCVAIDQRGFGTTRISVGARTANAQQPRICG